MKWKTTVLITAGSVNKKGFVFTEEVLKKLEDPDKGIRFSYDLGALIKEIPPPAPETRPPPLGYHPDPPRLDESNPPSGGSGVPGPVLDVEEEQILPINVTPTDLFAGLVMAALIIRDGIIYPKAGDEGCTDEKNLADIHTPWAALIAKQLAEEIRNG